MSSGTQYMLQKNPCTRFAFAYIWYPDSNNSSNRVGIRNIVWPKRCSCKEVQVRNKPHTAERWMDGTVCCRADTLLQCCYWAGSRLLSPPSADKPAAHDADAELIRGEEEEEREG